MIGGKQQRALHEFRPDRQRRPRARELELAVVVESDPDHADQLRRESREPAVARRSGLARRRGVKAARPHSSRRPAIHHSLHQIHHQVRHARIEHGPRLRLAQISNLAFRIRHLGDQARPDVDAFVRIDRVGAGDVERTRFVGSQRDRGRRFDVIAQSGRLCEPRDGAVAGHLGQLHRWDINRLRQRIPHCHFAVDGVMKVAGRVGLVAAEERGRLVVEHRRRCDWLARVGQRGAQRRRVDERLEHRSGLALRQRAVQLGLIVIPAADQRLDLACMRIDRHQRHLRRLVDGTLQGLLLELLVDVRHPDPHSLVRRALQIEIERGVNAQRLFRRAIVERFLQLVAHKVDEVGRRAGVRRRRDRHRRGDGAPVVALGDHAVLPHQREHQVAPLPQPVDIAERMKVAWPLDQPREQRGFGQRHRRHVLAEIGRRRRAETVQAERAAPSQVHLVAVVFEDLLFAQPLFQAHRDRDFDHLPAPALILLEPHAAGKLHAQRGGALVLSPLLEIDPGGFDHARKIEAVVVEEMLVLGGEHRVDEHFRNLPILNDAAILAVVVGDIHDQPPRISGIYIGRPRERPFAQLPIGHPSVLDIGDDECQRRGRHDRKSRDRGVSPPIESVTARNRLQIQIDHMRGAATTWPFRIELPGA